MNLRSFYLASLVQLFLSFQLAHGQLSPKESRITMELSRWLCDDLKKDGLHGSISVAIVRKRHVIWANAFGYSAPDEDSLLTPAPSIAYVP
jgi:hypothetical protein